MNSIKQNILTIIAISVIIMLISTIFIPCVNADYQTELYSVNNATKLKGTIKTVPNITILENTSESQIVQVGDVLITFKVNPEHTKAVMYITDLKTNDTEIINYETSKINNNYKTQVLINGNTTNITTSYDIYQPAKNVISNNVTKISGQTQLVSTLSTQTEYQYYYYDGLKYIAKCDYPIPDVIPYDHPAYDQPTGLIPVTDNWTYQGSTLFVEKFSSGFTTYIEYLAIPVVIVVLATAVAVAAVGEAGSFGLITPVILAVYFGFVTVFGFIPAIDENHCIWFWTNNILGTFTVTIPGMGGNTYILTPFPTYYRLGDKTWWNIPNYVEPYLQSYTITLQPGLNLISVPLVLSDDNIYNFFPSDVKSSVKIVWDYDPSDTSDPWRTWVPMGPNGNGDLTDIDVNHGYIVVLDGNSPKSFNVYGLKPDYVVPYSTLFDGKNFVGYPSSTIRPISDFYNQATIVWAYDSTPPGQWINYVPNMPGNDLTLLEPGHGYVVCKNYAYSSGSTILVTSTNCLTLDSSSDPISLPVPDASVISYDIPDVMVPGQSYDVSITLNNTGTWAWSEEDCIRLGGVGDSQGDAAKFSGTRFYIPNGTTVTPGDHYTWNFTMIAPSTPGVYNPQYQMVWEGYEWFGGILSKNITVGLPGYSYMKVHNITGSVDGALTNYQIMFTIHNGNGIDCGKDIYLNGHSLNWPNDMRFTNNVVTPLSYWIESYNGTVATVWVKMDIIAADPATTPIYVFCGKSGDVNQSNGSATFTFFDDFSGTSLNWSKWSRDNGAGSTAYFNVANGALSFGVTSYWGEVLSTIPTFGDNTAVSLRMKTISPTLDRTAYSNYYPVYNAWTWPADREGRQDRYWYTNNILGTYTISPQTYFIQDACVDGTSLSFNTNGASWASTNNYNPQAAPVQFYANWANSGFVVDWVFVRNYTANEPIQPMGMMRASVSTKGPEADLPADLSQDRMPKANKTKVDPGDSPMINSSAMQN